MLFNSFVFVFVFLPIAWVAFVSLARRRYRIALSFLCIASFVFYGYSSVWFLAIMLSSVVVNFCIASLLIRTEHERSRRVILAIGVMGNLSVIGYFKYANFFIENVGAWFGYNFVVDVALPLGISFYTFQKIALLVDIYRRDVKSIDPLSYLFFISFFPQLIAGPIVHYTEIVPQLHPSSRNRLDDLCTGSSMFAIGLFKKVVVADTVAVPSSRFFNGVAAGAEPNFADSWLAALCYALQIYYDFSAYSDMAVGLGRMFGIDLPINFASPYKSGDVIDFWRRWHITLSRLLRDYLYIPLGGGRRGAARRSVNLLATMLIGGAWHGAAWAFIAWGGLHGVFLLVNHWWSGLALAQRANRYCAWRAFAVALTLICVIFAWVPFRAGDFGVALTIWKTMLGFGVFENTLSAATVGPRGAVFALGLLAVTLILPNIYEIMRTAKMGTPTRGYPATYINGDARMVWAPNLSWAVILGAMFGLSIIKMNDASEFIYFQF